MMKQPNCQEVGRTLKKLKNVIMNEWEAAVRDWIPPSEKEHSIIIRDHVQDIVENLILFLLKDELDEIELGKAHGNHRAILTTFAVQDILQEYALLRETLITYLYPIGNIECAKLVHKFLDIVAKNSVTEFLSETYVKRVRKLEDGSEINELKKLKGVLVKGEDSSAA